VTDHVEGKPVSYTTYNNHKCRCDGCRKANREAMARFRADPKSRTGLRMKAEPIMNWEAAKWVRENNPGVWRRIKAEAEARVGLTQMDQTS
jgi:hypothetical protein